MRNADADELIKRIQDRNCNPCIKDGGNYNGVRCRACEVDDMIIEIDYTVDMIMSETSEKAAEIMKEAFYFFDNKYLHMFTCSRCYMPVPQINEFYTKQISYCAFCGAKISRFDKSDASPENIRGVERRLDNQVKTFTEDNARSSEA